MASRRYRVLKQLPWIEGGRPVPGFEWEGGRAFVYQPGPTIEVDDRELPGIYHRIEGIDDAGRAALEAIRARAEAPAQRTAVADLHPRAAEWLTRALDERLRRRGRMRELCSRLLARGDDPTDDDLAAALEESPEDSLPRELSQYLVDVLRQRVQRKVGRKAAPRTTADDLFIQSAYHLAVEDLKERFAHQKRPPIRRMAKEKVADCFGLSVRTVERIVSPRPWTKDGRGIKESCSGSLHRTMSGSPPTTRCPDCGTRLADEPWAEGLCLACLLELAVASAAGHAVGDPGEDPTLVEPGAGLEPGRVVGGRYRIRSLLGRGGMGEVWLAFDIKLRVDVALKALAASRTGPTSRRRAARRGAGSAPGSRRLPTLLGLPFALTSACAAAPSSS